MSEQDNTQFLKHPKDIDLWLQRYGIADYSIDAVKPEDKELYYGLDWVVNAKNVFFFSESIPQLPVCFGVVESDFLCQFCQLTSLKGTPSVVKGNFLIRENNLTSLDFGPVEVHQDYLAANNDITHIGGPNLRTRYIGGEFCVQQNPLQIIEYVPMKPEQYFKLSCQPTEKANDRINGVVRPRPQPLAGFEHFYNPEGVLKITGAQYQSVCEKLSLNSMISTSACQTKVIRKI